MNDRYGVDPCAATSVGELANLLRQFRPEHGRFIFDFPPDWHTEVRMHFRDARDLERKKLTEWIRAAKQSFLPTTVRYSGGLPWAKNAEYLTGTRSLIGPDGSRPPCRALTDVLSDPDAFPDCRGGQIPRTPAAYADVARPLFQISSKVVLVDRYFRLRREKPPFRRSESHFRSLKALIRAAQDERKVEVFKLMVSEAMIDECGEAAFEADLSAVLKEAGGDGVAIEYGLLDPAHPLDRHPRFLLGTECGLGFDWGFDTANDDSTNHVEWIGRAALKPLLERFM